VFAISSSPIERVSDSAAEFPCRRVFPTMRSRQIAVGDRARRARWGGRAVKGPLAFRNCDRPPSRQSNDAVATEHSAPDLDKGIEDALGDLKRHPVRRHSS
jgi:hypothetical protein